MNFYQDENEGVDDQASDAGDNTMAVLSTLGGGDGEDAFGEGERLGLDPDAGKAKISGSTLAVGVVIAVGAAALLGMKLTLGSIGAGTDPTDAMAQIDGFIATHNAALSTGNEGPISVQDAESQQVLEQLKQDPTDHQVPAEKVEKDPFDQSAIIAPPAETTVGGEKVTVDERGLALDRAKRAAANFKVDAIAGDVVFIDGEKYRVGDEIGDSGFALSKVEGLTCIIRTTDRFNFAFRLRYR